jgi:hypothetical protein
MNATYLGVLEAGGNMLSVETLLDLAEVLDADAAEIVREVEQARREEKRRLEAPPAMRKDTAPEPEN